MANKYPLVKQEKESWSLPACLQSIIKLRRIQEPSQREIVKRLGIGNDYEGDLCWGMGEFLEQYNLGCRYENPFINIRGYDALLEGELNCKSDVIVAYDWDCLNNRKRNFNKYFSIVLKYNPSESKPSEDFLVVKDMWRPEEGYVGVYRLEKFLTAINPDEDEEYGFYMID